MHDKKYFYELDILRGIACLLVYFHHLPICRILGIDLLPNGYCGVYLFYVISGFIISVGYDYQIIYSNNLTLENLLNSFEQNKPKIYQFWYRRFIRLFPTLLFLAIVSLILLIREGIRNHEVKLIILLLSFIKYWLGLCFLNHDYSYISTSSAFVAIKTVWSLPGEILCYIFFPILISFRKFSTYLVYFIIASLFIKITFFNSLRDFYPTILGHLDEFCIGVFIGLFYKKISINKSWLKIFVIISLSNLVPWLKYPQSHMHYLSIIISSAILVYASSLQNGILNWRIFGRFLNYVGRRSYFVYLTHMSANYIMYGKAKMLYKYLAQYSVSINNLLMKNKYATLDNYYHLVLLFIVLAFAEIFHRYVEIPFNKKYKNKSSITIP